jgi:rhodanese-related sulfurtransferase
MNSISRITVIFLLAPLAADPVFAVDPSQVPEKWHTPYGLYTSPVEAYEMKTKDPDGTVFIDIRTRAEVKYTGMADVVDANIPIRTLRPDYAWSDESNTYRTRPNKDFVRAVENLLAKKGLDKNAPIILMCKSGSRVPIAARTLYEEGFARVYTQNEGFEGIKARSGPDKGKRLVNGWKNSGLPWSYTLDKSKMYFNFIDNK